MDLLRNPKRYNMLWKGVINPINTELFRNV